MHTFDIALRSGRHSGMRIMLESKTDPKNISVSTVFTGKVLETHERYTHLIGKEVAFSTEIVTKESISAVFA